MASELVERKRKAYIRYRLETEPDLTEDRIYIIHADKSQRPLYTSPGWTPDRLDDDDLPQEVQAQESEASSSSAAAPKPSKSKRLIAQSAESSKESLVSTPPEPIVPTPPTPPPGPTIPRATTSVPKFGRLSSVNPPPPAKLRPTPKIRPAVVPKAIEETVAPAPSAKARLVPKEPSVPPPSAPVRARLAPKEPSVPPPSAPVNASLVPKEPSVPPPSASAGEGFIDSNILGGGTLITSPVTNRRVKLRDSIRNPVTRVVLLDFHNTIDRYFVPNQRRPYTIPYPSNRPSLLPDYFLV